MVFNLADVALLGGMLMAVPLLMRSAGKGSESEQVGASNDGWTPR